MKPLFIGFLIWLLFAHIACVKEQPVLSATTTPPPHPALPLSNQSIWVDANMNITIERPMNFAILNGAVSGPGRNGAKMEWQQLTGPAGCVIEYPDSAMTKVSKLAIGIYLFQLTATTISGETMSDTMTLTVQNATSASGQIIFSNLQWGCPFGCSIYFGDITPYMPANNTISVYIRRQNSTNWDLVVPDSIFTTEQYFYSIWGGQLSVFENSFIDATDHPEIKIVF